MILLDDIKINNVVLPNRIVVAPMCQYSANNGSPTEWHYGHLSQLLTSGAGLVMLESTAVMSEGKITKKDLCLQTKQNFDEFSKLVSFLKKINSTPIGIQLSHAGRKGSSYVPWVKNNTPLSKENGAWLTSSASPIPRCSGWPTPSELSLDSINEISQEFVRSSIWSDKIGFDVLEIHMAHGYLLHQFFSPVSNKRNDVYGGSLNNRCKFLLQIAQSVREVWPDNKILGARITGSDWLEEGSSIEDCIFLAQKLEDIGFDYVCISSGGILPITNLVTEKGYQVHLSREVKNNTNLLIRTSGMINSIKHAEQIVKEKSADFIAIGRKFLKNPRWLYDYSKKIIPSQYKRYRS
tara:strand:- start:20 stop:1072 length:1053 start_codon:yes stop_codon:yes gene_type:complete